MKITKCEGNGQGLCSRCGSINWMSLLCKIEVCTNNIAYAINYLQNKNGLLEEMTFTRC